ncbi:MAG: GAF domain-containing protein [Bacillota bacterium]|nr:GAF domain-containing protein [Bacillota bacterium]
MTKRWKLIIAYIIGFFLAIMLVLILARLVVFGGAFCESTWDEAQVFKIIGTLIGLFYISISIGRFIVTSPNPIPFGGVSLPNRLYDANFESKLYAVDKKLVDENEGLITEIEDLKQLIQELNTENENTQTVIDQCNNLADIFIRHHNNASRLVRSSLQLWMEGQVEWLREFCNNVLDECVTTLTLDRADKSSSIYFIQDDHLIMYAYNRIEFSSVRGRKFKKDEGFAGTIWSEGEPKIIHDVNQHPLFSGFFVPQHDYGSILGYPIKLGNCVIGVLCIESEQINGFSEDDLVMVGFYADICGLAYYCNNLVA